MSKNRKPKPKTVSERYSELLQLRRRAEAVSLLLLRQLGAHAYETEARALSGLLDTLVRAAAETRGMFTGESGDYVLPEFALAVLAEMVGEMEQTEHRVSSRRNIG